MALAAWSLTFDLTGAQLEDTIGFSRMESQFQPNKHSIRRYHRL